MQQVETLQRGASAAADPRRRRGAAAVLAVMLAGLALVAWVYGPRAGAAAEHRGAGSNRPNVVVITTDDQNVGRDVRIMKHVRTDLIDKGVTFRNFFATFPLCCPSRATYFTGQYAHNHGVESNTARDGGGFQSFDSSHTTAVALDDAGYKVGLIGKFMNGYRRVARQNPKVIPPGFDRWFVPLDNLVYNWDADDQGVIRSYDGPTKYQTSVYVRKSKTFLRKAAHKGQPFWLTVAVHAPHTEGIDRWPNPRPAPRDRGKFDDAPLPKPPSFNERDVSDKPAFLRAPRLTADLRTKLRKQYRSRLASLLSVDRLVDDLVRKVRRLHEMRDTWFIFWSDNGYLLGEHRLKAKTVLYDDAVRVPLIIRGPHGKFPRGVTRRQFTGNIDLSPTILDITGVQPQLEVDGLSLLPFGRRAHFDSHRDILLENRPSKAVRTRRWMYAVHDPDDNGTPDAFELYDMRDDPYQLHNLYEKSLDPSRHPRLAAARQRLSQRLAELRHCAGHDGPDPCD